MEEERLLAAREAIAEADREMARLFEKRMQAAAEIAAYKRERGLPILDAAQEKRVIERDLGYIETDALRGLYVQFIRGVMDVSKKYQRRLMEGMRVAYSGVEGAFAHIAARRIFPEGVLIPCADFPSAYAAVEAGECDVCVLPVENSYAGEVGQVLDLMFTGSLHVTGMYALPVTHHLLGAPGATLADVRRVVSHPQALAQCAAYIRRRGLESLPAANTARAARQVGEAKDPALAAIASRETAELYGLTILDEDINDSGLNSTRFAVFSRAENRELPAQASGFLLQFTVNHIAGALAQALQVIGGHGFNMRTLRSRPMKDLPWHYYFYAEVEGDDRGEAGRRMLDELRACCNQLKVAGRYAADILLEDTKEEMRP